MLKIENLTKIYGENVKKRAYPAYMFGRIGEGDVIAMLKNLRLFFQRNLHVLYQVPITY